jgi:hypothetical protein
MNTFIFDKEKWLARHSRAELHCIEFIEELSKAYS